MNLEQLFQRPAALPTVPKVMQELIHSFEHPDVKIDAIARLLDADPVLSAKTLRLANSAYFHVSRTVETVDDALRMLGFVMVRNMVLAAGMGQAFRNTKGIDLPVFWRHSLYTAGGARWLAGVLDFNSELAFTTGLLQGLGHLVLRAGDAAALAALDKRCPPLADGRAAAEQEALGFHHGHVARELARRWNFPATMSDALAAIPEESRVGEDALVGLVRLARWHAGREVFPPPRGEARPPLPSAPDGLFLDWDGEPPQLVAGASAHERQPLPQGAALAAGLEGLFEA